MPAPTRLAPLAALALLTASAPALAQGIASNADEPQAGEEVKGSSHVAVIDEVVRGFYVSVDYGANYYIPLKSAGFVNLNSDGLSPGTRMGVRAGYDILNNIQLELFLLANFNEGTIDGQSISGGILNGDVAHFAPGVALRFDFITSDDQRFFAFGRVGAGYAFWFPKQLAVDAQHPCHSKLDAQGTLIDDPGCGNAGSIHTDASVGVEYYTKLRHLSVGLEVDVQALIAPTAIGVMAYPTLKYTF